MANIKTGIPTRNPGAKKPNSGGTQAIMNGGKGNKGVKGGVTTEMDMKLGTRMAKAAANGKAY